MVTYQGTDVVVYCNPGKHAVSKISLWILKKLKYKNKGLEGLTGEGACYVREHEELSLIPRTSIKSQTPWHTSVNPVQGR